MGAALVVFRVTSQELIFELIPTQPLEEHFRQRKQSVAQSPGYRAVLTYPRKKQNFSFCLIVSDSDCLYMGMLNLRKSSRLSEQLRRCYFSNAALLLSQQSVIQRIIYAVSQFIRQWDASLPDIRAFFSSFLLILGQVQESVEFL